MSLFDSLIKHGMPLVPKFIVGKVARRYVAGEGIEEAAECIRQLNSQGTMATVDVLGEEVVFAEELSSVPQPADPPQPQPHPALSDWATCP